MTKSISAHDERSLVGTHEFVAFPTWEIYELRAKIDTGAKNSALHVEDIELRGDCVCFAVRLDRDDQSQRVECTATVARHGRVRSSTGILESRIFIRTPVRIGNFEQEVEVSLVDRGEMRYRMLIGRETLRAGNFLVDVHRRYVQKRPRSKTKKPVNTSHECSEATTNVPHAAEMETNL